MDYNTDTVACMELTKSYGATEVELEFEKIVRDFPRSKNKRCPLEVHRPIEMKHLKRQFT